MDVGIDRRKLNLLATELKSRVQNYNEKNATLDGMQKMVSNTICKNLINCISACGHAKLGIAVKPNSGNAAGVVRNTSESDSRTINLIIPSAEANSKASAAAVMKSLPPGGNQDVTAKKADVVEKPVKSVARNVEMTVSPNKIKEITKEQAIEVASGFIDKYLKLRKKEDDTNQFNELFRREKDLIEYVKNNPLQCLIFIYTCEFGYRLINNLMQASETDVKPLMEKIKEALGSTDEQILEMTADIENVVAALAFAIKDQGKKEPGQIFYRGTADEIDVIRSKYAVGNSFDYNKFVSISSDLAVGEKFAMGEQGEGDKYQLIMKFVSPDCYNVAHLSNKPDESEFLILPYSSFKIYRSVIDEENGKAIIYVSNSNNEGLVEEVVQKGVNSESITSIINLKELSYKSGFEEYKKFMKGELGEEVFDKFFTTCYIVDDINMAIRDGFVVDDYVDFVKEVDKHKVLDSLQKLFGDGGKVYFADVLEKILYSNDAFLKDLVLKPLFDSLNDFLSKSAVYARKSDDEFSNAIKNF